MSIARQAWSTADPVDAPARHRTPFDIPPVARPRDAVQLLALQRMAGNRAVSSLVTVQRCGPVPAGECPCNDDAESDGQDMSTESSVSPTTDQHGPSGVPLQSLEV